jgi:hypothetical protein
MNGGQKCLGERAAASRRRARSYRTVFALSVMHPSVPFRRACFKKADTHGSHRAQDLFTRMPICCNFHWLTLHRVLGS